MERIIDMMRKICDQQKEDMVINAPKNTGNQRREIHYL
jgi:hypothetical protein